MEGRGKVTRPAHPTIAKMSCSGCVHLAESPEDAGSLQLQDDRIIKMTNEMKQ